MRISAGRCIGRSGRYPTISVGSVSATSVEITTLATAAPYDHVTASPDCGVQGSRVWSIGGASSYPAIQAGVVFSAGVQTKKSLTVTTPDDHFAASPSRCVMRPC